MVHANRRDAIRSAMAATQLSLFDDDPAVKPAKRHEFVASPEFVERIRSELTTTLAMVRAADRLPWPDLTRTTLAELPFRSIVRYLPPLEAEALRAAFDAEIERLYALEDARAAAAETGGS
jgi:hypothetical protein